jgi:maltose alpha-D-glucosyltransferase / alpha-amylase
MPRWRRFNGRSVRTPFQWNDEPNADFSRASSDKLPRPVISDGSNFDYRNLNFLNQRRDPTSLLNTLARIIRTRKESAQIGTGRFQIVETDQPETVFAHACLDDNWCILALHNLSDKELPNVRVQLWDDRYSSFMFLFEERDREKIAGRELSIDLPPYGYSWLRLRPEAGREA